MDSIIFICLIAGIQAISWLAGRRASKNISDEQDYFFAGKNIRLFPLMMTFFATQVGGGAVLGATQEAYQFGWPALLYPLGIAFGLIALGTGFGKKLALLGVSTVAEIFEKIYGSSLLRKFASLLSVISLFMILVAQIIASNKFLVSLGWDNTWLFIGFWTIVILYTTQGGLKAVISTDIIQALFFSAVFIFCFVFLFFSQQEAISLITAPKIDDFSTVSSKMCGWLLMPLLFMLIEQDMGQRCFAGKTPRVVTKATILAGIATMLICTVPVFFGMLAKAKGIAIPQGGSVLMSAVTAMTSPTICAFVGCAVLAAIISTATSLMNAISSNISCDFGRKTNNDLGFVKKLTCLVSILAIAFAFYFDNIVDLLIQSYELSVSCLCVSIVAALGKKELPSLAAFCSVLLGALSFFFLRLYPLEFPREVASIGISLVGFWMGQLITAARTRVRI